MSLKEISDSLPFPNLNWDSNKRCFEVLDSTDRKIISFLFEFVTPTRLFFREKLMSNSPLAEKEITLFRPLLLTTIESLSQKLIRQCPIEDYKTTLSEFYNDLMEQIRTVNLSNSDSKETALRSLEKICNDCYMKLFSQPPLNIPHRHFRDLPETIERGQCFHYAFYLAKEYKVLNGMSPSNRRCEEAFLLYPHYFLQQLGYSETKSPRKGDLVLYQGDQKLDNNLRFKHLGVLTEKGTVKSAWRGYRCEFEHQLSQVPYPYGSEITFYERQRPHPESFEEILLTTSQMSDLIIQFNSHYIPSPASTHGALDVLFAALKVKCKECDPSSAHWPWKAIEENLFNTLNPSTLKRSEVIKEFQLWMKETLPQYF